MKKLICETCGGDQFCHDSPWIRDLRPRLYIYECKNCNELTTSFTGETPDENGLVLSEINMKGAKHD